MPDWPHWQQAVSFGRNGPGVVGLHDSDELKVVLVGLRTGQALPAHPGPAASFVFLDGEATVTVGAEEIAVGAGAIVVVPTGVQRAVRAVRDTVFLGNLGDPRSEARPS